MSANTNRAVWIDLGVPDLEQATDFYGRVFGWTFTDGGDEYGHYHQITASDGSLVGGLMQNPDPAMPVFWMVYFGTNDAEGTSATIAQSGGSVFRPAMPVGDMGSMAIVTAPSGATFGLWQAGTLSGFGEPTCTGMAMLVDTPTKDLTADVAAYEKAFGWDIVYGDGEGGEKFATVGPYEDAQICLFDAAEMFPADHPSSWRVFFRTDDMDATVAAIKDAGGVVTDGPVEEEEGTVVATAKDPFGAVFLVMQVDGTL
ncbi:VOC family protein [Nigerium massiliense]|uniref:VOC family protein n=1 Tax=Nigerium massiliense TaxID=1522317 RepID=UPI0006947A88|nr:VOC family protein [Nigerium massiliense]